MYELYEINKKSCVFLNTLCKYKTIEIVKPLCKYSFKSFKKFIYDLYWSFITNGKAKIYIILDNNNEIIHSSYVIPHCYKFPFLRGGYHDIQIGPCITQQKYRGQGLYPYVLSNIVTNELNVNDKAYMIIDHENQASIKAVLKIGFAKKNPIKKTKTKKVCDYITERGEIMNIKGWKYYNHAMIPTTAPHESVNLKPLLDGSIWKMSGRKPLLARWTSDFDCGYEKEWWYCIKDTPFDISQLKSKHRYEINKGNKNYYFKKINSSEYMEELWDVTEQSFTAYPQEYRPSLNKEKFILEIADWNKTYTVIAVFNKTSDELCGYALLKEHKSYVDFSVLKAKPEYEKSGINAAIVFAVINEYNKQLEEGGFYICDGCRNILHETNFQNYLEKYFGFRKAFCTLNIEYRKDFKLLVKMLYPLRGMFKKLKGKLSHQISSILFMEELNRKM